MPITIDATNVINDKDQTSLTKSHTTASDANLMLVFMVTTDSGTTKYTSGITYDGDALTKIATAEDESNQQRAEIWKLENPNSGSANVVASFTDTIPAQCMAVMTFKGVDETTMLGTAVTDADNTGSDPSVAVTNTVTDGLVVDCVAHKDVNGDPSISVGSGQTLRQYNPETVSSKTTQGVSSEPGNDGTVTMSWSVFDTNVTWAQAAVEIKPMLGYVNDIDGVTGNTIDNVNGVDAANIETINTV